MKVKVILLLILLAISMLPSYVCLAQSTNNQVGTLSIEVFARDDKSKRPASKTKFYLLDAEIETIFRNAGLKEIRADELVDTYGMAVWRSESPEYKELYKQKYKDFHIAADAALKSHIIQTVVTDSKGKARFKALTPGTYYLFGIAKINKGISIIRSPIEVKSGENAFVF
jgi:hypothetical protein